MYGLAHSNLRSPIPRGNTRWSSYCSRGQGCPGPCESLASESQFTLRFYPKQLIRRGERLRVEWLRQNHPGGFVRLAFVPFSQSDNATRFEASVAKFVCYETNCGENEADQVLGAMNGRGDDVCSTYVSVPGNLPDGPVTMQWLWFGGGVYFSNNETAFANYYNCADLELVGGVRSSQAPPTFQGGDATTQNPNMCRYWGSNRVGECPMGFETGDQCGRSKVKFGPPAGIN
ncbi:hypothetical protein DSO57_1028304 [Entomophthora muscae]|uniref:Uncharacterized protein n=1 Tax=Entomophthora muscae TaxID=34485 RepID=A0ACC2T1I8_9FUNG|nr:hypothetical protein DSO57_1028304 [Entomophthora muscae]